MEPDATKGCVKMVDLWSIVAKMQWFAPDAMSRGTIDMENPYVRSQNATVLQPDAQRWNGEMPTESDMSLAWVAGSDSGT